MTSLRHDRPKIKSLTLDCLTHAPLDCTLIHFCFCCKWELNLDHPHLRIPYGEGFLCPHCARKKKVRR